VRRHGRENNFKSVLETIRGLLEGAGSIERVIPPWLRPVILGYGEPSAAHYLSETMKSYATNTVGVNKPTDYLDFGDTFLDESHLRDSFGGNIVVDGKESIQEADGTSKPRSNFRIRFSVEIAKDESTKSCVDAVSVPFPRGVTGNPIRFTPIQVEAIRSGMSPGLTLVVGPPGTGKYAKVHL
jgi:intron-binding protein aquarius